MKPNCEVCGRPKKRGGPTCSRCYMAQYRQDPERRARHREAVKRYRQTHLEARRRHVRSYLAGAKIRAAAGIEERLAPAARRIIAELLELTRPS